MAVFDSLYTKTRTFWLLKTRMHLYVNDICMFNFMDIVPFERCHERFPSISFLDDVVVEADDYSRVLHIINRIFGSGLLSYTLFFSEIECLSYS